MRSHRPPALDKRRFGTFHDVLHHAVAKIVPAWWPYPYVAFLTADSTAFRSVPKDPTEGRLFRVSRDRNPGANRTLSRNN